MLAFTDEAFYNRLTGKEIPMRVNGEVRISESPSNITLKLTGSASLPREYALEQNYPNPFNPVTLLRYQLPVESNVKVRIYNLLGQEVKTLVDGRQPPGYQSQEWDSADEAGRLVGSGVYFYRIDATSTADPRISFAKVRKMVLLR